MMDMRPAILALAGVAGLALAGSVRAETLQEVTTHGIVISLGDTNIDLSFTPDGKFTGQNGAITGTWRIDGDKLCTKTARGESCTTYPAGKKSGDTFEVPNEGGSVKIHIK